MAKEEHFDFENEVRRIAGLLWPTAGAGGAVMHQKKEHDGLYWTEEAVYAVEATTSRSLEKARNDMSKIEILLDDVRKKHPSILTKGWFVTRDEPTADQRSAASGRAHSIQAISLVSLMSRLVDARDYLDLRTKYAFGSVDTSYLDRTGYLDQPLNSGGLVVHGVDALCNVLRASRSFVLLGDYGSGKSSTIRQVFLALAEDFRKARHNRFPICLNLRDHIGQDDPTEALTRHAQRIGFAAPHQLIRAWRAGIVDLLLDGFDELTAVGWVEKKRRLTEIRRTAMTLVRKFHEQQPRVAGIAVAGRTFFFDDNAMELPRALGTRPNTMRVEVGEFTETSAKVFVERLGWRGEIPAWFPTRPLLLGYIVRRVDSQALDQIHTREDLSGDAGLGWNYLLDCLCERESKQSPSLDAASIRLLIERLASIVRTRSNGLGPISREEMVRAFEAVIGVQPDEAATSLLQRLPGLRTATFIKPQSSTELDDLRQFIDDGLADAARAGDVARFATAPYDTDLSPADPATWTWSLGSVGVAVLDAMTEGMAAGQLTIAIRVASEEGKSIIVQDLVASAIERGVVPGANSIVRDTVVDEISIDESHVDLSGVTYVDCIVRHLEFTGLANEDTLPRFQGCHFELVVGRRGPSDLPATHFNECTFGKFGQPGSTTDALLDQPLPPGLRVMLTLLKKLFLQRGRGRQDSALYRGLAQADQRLVASLVKLLASNDLVSQLRIGSMTVWVPNRRQAARAKRILAAPATIDDELVRAAMTLT